MQRVLDRLRREESGFTIIEAVIAIALTLLITTTALNVLDRAYANNDKIQKKTDAQSSVRIGLDGVTRLLRSQVCANSSIAPMVSASATSITFYADFSDASPSNIPERHTITVNAATGQLTDTRVPGAGTADTPTYTGTATTRVLASGITPATGIPAFQFYAYNSATPSTATTALNSAASPNVAAADLPRIARITVTLRGNPRGILTATKNTLTLQDEVFVRLSNPNSDGSSDPTCL
jgi:type II secretory pathway pseudopilin PulG